MGRIPLSLFLVPVALILQQAFRSWVPLACFLPILLILWAWRMNAISLMALVLLAGLVEDFLIPDTFFFSSILVWGIVTLIVRTQRTLMNSFRYFIITPILFAATFLFLSFDRLIFLAGKGTWSWNESLTIHIMMASFLNAVLGPFILIALTPFYPHQRIQVKDLPDFP